MILGTAVERETAVQVIDRPRKFKNGVATSRATLSFTQSIIVRVLNGRQIDNSLNINYIYKNNMKSYDLKDDPYLKVLRPLVEAYQSIFEVGHKHIRSMGLTPAQFDVIAELGGTNGMTAVELSHSTLLAKASLTGIIDRLEEKGLVERKAVPSDRRSMTVQLTKAGAVVHRKCFPAQVKMMRPYFEQALSQQEISILKDMLIRLRNSCKNPRLFTSGSTGQNVRK